MLGFRRWLVSVAILSGLAHAGPQLTTIQDIVYNADGTRFNGLVTISWQSFDAGDSSNIASQVLRVPITNGYLQVQLAPSTTAQVPQVYTVTYAGTGGVQFSESWSIPPSPTPLRVKDVRVSPAAGSLVGAPPQTIIHISDVVGLQSALNVRPVMGTGYASSRTALINSVGALDGAVGNPTDCVHVDGTSGACGVSGGASLTFVDGETPAGVQDGVNATYTLAKAPDPSSSLALYRNGMLLKTPSDYTLSGNTIVFVPGEQPSSGDILQSFYRSAGTVAGVGFVDNEVPGGSIDGVNTVFTLSQTASPPASIALYRNGILLKVNVDYTVSGTTLTFSAGLAPQTGDILQCSYRIAQ